jgi:hypothetical protein
MGPPRYVRRCRCRAALPCFLFLTRNAAGIDAPPPPPRRSTRRSHSSARACTSPSTCSAAAPATRTSRRSVGLSSSAPPLLLSHPPALRLPPALHCQPDIPPLVLLGRRARRGRQKSGGKGRLSKNEGAHMHGDGGWPPESS